MAIVITTPSTEVDKFLSDLTLGGVEQKFIDKSDISTTAKEMLVLIRKGITDARANKLATMLTKGIAGRDFDGIAGRLYRWITYKIKYHRDPAIMEWLQDWEATLKRGAGDCDDFTIISGTLLGTLGIKTRVKIVQSGIRQWNHVYLQYYSPKQKKWIGFDASQMKEVGWEPQTIFGEMIYNV